MIVAAACLAIGYFLDLADITPIIKRIATSSFTLVSLGWLPAGRFFFTGGSICRIIESMSCFCHPRDEFIFIYLFFEIVGDAMVFNEYITAIASGVMKDLFSSRHVSAIFSSLCIFALEWGLCWWLWKKKIYSSGVIIYHVDPF